MADATQKTVRIFISSPGDVHRERELARRVIEGLQRQYPGTSLQPVLWEDLPLPATATFQETIDLILRDNPIDIAVFILWSRLGSPLGPATVRPDRTPYRSGTEREFDLMLTAFDRSGHQRPIILAYTRDDDGGFKRRLTESPKSELEELIAQHQLTEQFIDEQFTDSEGHAVRACHSYQEPVSFAQRLRVHLVRALDDMLGADAATRWEGDPYRGLSVFEIEHAPIFHGRDEETCELLQRLRDQRRRDGTEAGAEFVVIVGASGSGKSSLARAGVAANLVRYAATDDVARSRAAVFIPGLATIERSVEPVHSTDLHQPQDAGPGSSSNDARQVTDSDLGDEFGAANQLCEGLVRTLSQALPELAGSSSLNDMADGFSRDPALTVKLSLVPAFERAAEESGQPVRLLVVLDQMEELWTDRQISAEDRQRFFKAIEALARSGHVAVLATLRSDLYPQAQLLQTFLDLKGERGHFDLLPPGAAALGRLIRQPARLAGLQFERVESTGRSLDDVILEEAARNPEALPLLQYVLDELARMADSQERLLTFAAYERLGGITGAVGRRAEEVISQLPAGAQAAFAEIMPQLVTVDIDGDLAAVRRRALLSDLASTPARKQLTEALVAQRFLTAGTTASDSSDVVPENPVPGESSEATASLVHEAMLSSWSRLADWVQSNREFLRLRARVEQSEHRWERHARDDSLLLPSGLPLEEGRRLLSEATGLLSEPTADYVRALIKSHEHQARRRRTRRRVVMTALSVLTLLAGTIAVYAMSQREQAIDAQQAAEAARISSETSEQKALASERVAKQQRDLAQQQSQLALDTMNAVIFDVQRSLANVAGGSSVRRGLLASILPRLDKISIDLIARSAVDRHTMVALQEMGDVIVEIGSIGMPDGSVGDSFQESGPFSVRPSKPGESRTTNHRSVNPSALSVARRLYRSAHDIAKKLASARPGNAQAQRDLMDSYANQGRMCLWSGSMSLAARYFRQSLEIGEKLAAAQPDNAQAQFDLSISCNWLGDVNLQMGDMTAATNYYLRDLVISENLAAAHPGNVQMQRGLSLVYHGLGDVSRQSGDLTAAAMYYSRGLEIHEKLAAAQPDNAQAQRDLSSSYNSLGYVSRRSGDLTAATKYYRQSLAIGEILVAADPGNVWAQGNLSNTYHGLGDVSRRSGNLIAATNYYRQSLEIGERLVAADPGDVTKQRNVSLVYDDLGMLSQQSGDLTAATRYYKQSLEISEKLAAGDPDNAQAQRDLSTTYSHMGTASLKMGDLTAAAKYYTQSFEISEKLAAADPDNAQAQRDLATTYDHVGSASLKMGDLTAAAKYYKGSLQIREKLAAAQPDNAQAQRDLSFSFYMVGHVNLEMGDLTSATKYYRQDFEINAQLAAADPGDAGAQRDLSISYQKLGELSLRSGDLTAAMKYHKQGFEIRAQLAAADPGDAGAQRDLSISYERLGELSLRSGNLTAAMNYHRQGFEIRAQLAAADPGNAQAQHDLMLAYDDLGVGARESFDWEKAIEHDRAALSVLKRMIENGQKVEASRRELAYVERRIRLTSQQKLAAGDWDTVVKLATETPRLLYYRAAQMAKQGKLEEATTTAAKLREIIDAKTTKKVSDLGNLACAWGLCAKLAAGWTGRGPFSTDGQNELPDEQRKTFEDYKKKTLRALREAIEGGWDDFEHMKTEPDLAALHGTDEFEALFPKDKNDQ